MFWDNQPGKKSINISTAFVAMFLMALSPLAWAARPMNTDDANIVDPKSCQLETWFKKNHGSSEYWAIPGCNFFADIEWSLGGQKQWNDTNPDGHVNLFQAKKRWMVLQPGGFGISTTFGLGHNERVDGSADLHRDRYINVPITYDFHGKGLLHVNIGVIHHHDLGVVRTTGGLGGEIPISSQSFLILETYGERGTAGKFQIGLRNWIIPQRMQLDMTYGNNALSTESRTGWFTLGLRLLSPPFLP